MLRKLARWSIELIAALFVALYTIALFDAWRNPWN